MNVEKVEFLPFLLRSPLFPEKHIKLYFLIYITGFVLLINCFESILPHIILFTYNPFFNT